MYRRLVCAHRTKHRAEEEKKKANRNGFLDWRHVYFVKWPWSHKIGYVCALRFCIVCVLPCAMIARLVSRPTSVVVFFAFQVYVLRFIVYFTDRKNQNDSQPVWVSVEVCICGNSRARIPIPCSLLRSSNEMARAHIHTAILIITIIIIIIVSMQNVCKHIIWNLSFL